jgi:hypothetical protein
MVKNPVSFRIGTNTVRVGLTLHNGYTQQLDLAEKQIHVVEP